MTVREMAGEGGSVASIVEHLLKDPNDNTEVVIEIDGKYYRPNGSLSHAAWSPTKGYEGFSLTFGAELIPESEFKK